MSARFFRRWFPTFIISISITALLVLFFLIAQKLTVLREAPGDNVTWGLSQVQVDLLHLTKAAQQAQLGTTPDLRDVRRRFNNAYSRVSGIRQGPVFGVMRADAEFADTVNDLQTQLDAMVPLVDGPDGTLQAGLSDVLAQVDRMGQGARDLAVLGIAIQSTLSDETRRDFSQLLWMAAAVTASLIIFLVVMSYAQLLQNKAFRRVTRAMDRANTRLKSSFEVSLDAIVVADDEGIILDFNDAAVSVFGFSRDEAIGAQMADLIIPHHLRGAHNAGMARLKRTGQSKLVGQGRIEITALRKSGEEFPVEISIGQTQDHTGTIFISYLRDITERLEAEQDLKQARDDALQAERAKSNFLAVMSHEMRTPLNGIFGTLELLRKTRLNKAQEKYLTIAKRSGDILLHHVNDVLDLTRLDAGELELFEDVFDLRGFFEDAIKTNEPAALQSGNALTLDISGIERQWALGDEQRLRQILFNLISNALKFTDQGTVAVTGRTTGDYEFPCLEFEVADTGVGISDQDQARVFDRFFTQEKSYDRMASGAGLGLAICRQIAVLMGGDISVTSEVGQGSTFKFVVPISWADAPDEETEADAPQIEPDMLQGHHILLVEDNEINRTIVREMLEGAGAHVSEAHNGFEAIRAAEAEAYAAILMDISMPTMNGVDATLEIRGGRSVNRETPILALTAHALEEEQQRFVEVGMNACLNKPVSQIALVQGLANVLGLDCAFAAQVQEATPDVLDPTIFGGLQTILKPERLADLTQKFEGEIEGFLASIPDHLETDALGPLAEAAHKSVGSAGVIGLLSFQADLRAVEMAAKDGSPDAVKQAAQQAQSAWPTARDALKAQV